MPARKINSAIATPLGVSFPQTSPKPAHGWSAGHADGDIDAMYDLGYLLLGLGDKDTAENWMEKAAEGGHPRAQVLYGDSLRFGNGSPSGSSFGWLIGIAERHAQVAIPIGLSRLAEAYDLGIGGPHPRLQAKTTVGLYRSLAAEQDYAHRPIRTPGNTTRKATAA